MSGTHTLGAEDAPLGCEVTATITPYRLNKLNRKEEDVTIGTCETRTFPSGIVPLVVPSRSKELVCADSRTFLLGEARIGFSPKGYKDLFVVSHLFSFLFLLHT